MASQFKVTSVKGKLYLVTIDADGVTDTIHQLKPLNATQAHKVCAAFIDNPQSLVAVANGTISNTNLL